MSKTTKSYSIGKRSVGRESSM